MGSKSYAIKGIGKAGRSPEGHIPVRREIDEWWFDQSVNAINQKSIFIYALIKFQARGWDRSDDLSYLSIAGIHGLPLTPWPADNPDSKKAFWYCAHGRVTFSTWHTPYMLLFEQRLYEEMRALIPSTFAKQDHQAMYQAADTWRLPYWDWAMKKPNWNSDNPADPVNNPKKVSSKDGPNVPFVITQKEIEVRTMTGAAKVRNPLYQYGVPGGKTFGDYKVVNYNAEILKERPDLDSPWIPECQITSRRPQLPSDLSADMWRKDARKVTPAMKSAYAKGSYQDWRDVQGALQGTVEVQDDAGNMIYKANSLPEAVNRLFNMKDGKSVLDFKHFSTSFFENGQPIKGYPSLEAIHNNIHDFTGGTGYFSDPATSAFDPIFWIHHCNVDRLLALWQTLFSKQYSEWMSEKDRPKDESRTALSPFSMDEKFTMFTSQNSSKMFDHFGYTYPELQEWKHRSKEEWLQSIKKTIDELYPTTAGASLQLKHNESARKKVVKNFDAADLRQSFFPVRLVAEAARPENTPDPGTTPSLAVENVSWTNNDYVVNVVYERFALHGLGYAIKIFLGAVPDISSSPDSHFDYSRDRTAIGEVYNFSSPVEGRGITGSGCGNCRDQLEAHALFSGQVILTDALIARVVGDSSRAAAAAAGAGDGGRLTSLDPDEVVPFLRENLHWRVVSTRGQIIPATDPRLSRLRVSVAVAEATHFATVGRQSEYGEYRHLWAVTDGRAGGAVAGDEIYAAAATGAGQG